MAFGGGDFTDMIFSGETEANLNTAMAKLSMDLVSEAGKMLQILADSMMNGTAVGIMAPVLGSEISVTAVEEIIIGKDVTVVLKNYDITGYMLETNKLRLGDIKGVCPFKSAFENPYMRTFRNG